MKWGNPPNPQTYAHWRISPYPGQQKAHFASGKISKRSWPQSGPNPRVGYVPVGQADTRGMSRFLLAGAVETEVDSAGRILVPDYLKDFAQLKSRVVLAGVSDRIEIWNEKTWEEYTRRIERSADQMAQTLGDLGIL
jgi:bifunctional DNA-binding transcriptional regulator/antitoxin component of YhaV-PrlF toxin-antitoxin module